MVEVTRSGELESFHQGVAVLINSSGDILKLKGLNSEKYSDKIEHVYENELVHCDNLVLV